MSGAPLTVCMAPSSTLQTVADGTCHVWPGLNTEPKTTSAAVLHAGRGRVRLAWHPHVLAAQTSPLRSNLLATTSAGAVGTQSVLEPHPMRATIRFWLISLPDRTQSVSHGPLLFGLMAPPLPPPHVQRPRQKIK